MKDWYLAARANRMDPSVLHNILKIAEQPNIISFAGGLPSPDTFPVEAFNAAYEKVMREQPRNALQYAASEGYGPLREWVARSLPWDVAPEQVLITTGSQQALDLVGKLFIDEGSRIAVQTPSYLGALQAFSVYGPEIWSVPNATTWCCWIWACPARMACRCCAPFAAKAMLCPCSSSPRAMAWTTASPGWMRERTTTSSSPLT